MTTNNEDFTTLREGDIAYTNSISGPNSPFFDVTVKSVSATGRVTLVDGRKFRPDGSSMSESSARLYLKTPERVKYMQERSARMNAQRAIAKINFEYLPIEKMLEIIEIVNREEVK